MTTTVTDLTQGVLAANSYDSGSKVFGLIAILLLIALLSTKEVIRAYDSVHSAWRLRALDAVIAPLVVSFGIVILFRFLDLLPG